jgi:Uma2 family endonuclease
VSGMAVLARKPATYADVLAAPRERVAELVEGELLVSPRPGGPHAAAASALLEELGPPFKRARGGPGGWILLFEPELHLGPDVLVPDLAGWRRERLPEITNEVPYFELAPDWVCEVLSTTTSQLDRTKKLPLYARAGVPSVWLVDPIARVLEVLVFEREKYVIDGAYADSARVRAVPFDAVELDLSLLWADVRL